jgi:hypothetical protein
VFRIFSCGLLFSFFFSSVLGAQDGNFVERKQARAVRAADGSVRVDGRLDDHAWDQALPIVDFIQKEPDEGAPPAEDMEVRFLYDSGAIYIGARMHKRSGAGIQG